MLARTACAHGAVRSQPASAAGCDGPGTGRLGPTEQTQRMQESITQSAIEREREDGRRRAYRPGGSLLWPLRTVRSDTAVDIHEPVWIRGALGHTRLSKNEAIAPGPSCSALSSLPNEGGFDAAYAC